MTLNPVSGTALARAASCWPYLGASLLKAPPIAADAYFFDIFAAAVLGCNTRKSHKLLRDSTSIRAVFVNMYGTTNNLGAAAVTYSASLEVGAGFVPFTFNGKYTADCDPGAVLVSDPVFAPMKAGTSFFIRTHAACASGVPFTYYNATQSGLGEGCDAINGVNQPDYTQSGSISANSVSHCSAICILGDSGTNSPTVLHFGDSIADGLGDTTGFTLGRGFLRRAMIAASVPYLNVAVPGAFTYNPDFRSFQMAQVVTDVIDQMGINDVNAGESVFPPGGSITGNLVLNWLNLGAFGGRVWRTTVTPYTSSTDNWATATNQTPGAHEANRVSLNNWIRDGAPLDNAVSLTPVAVGTSYALRAGQPGHPLAGYFETADAVEVNASNVLTRNGGRWQVGSVYTADTAGLHPSSTGHSALAGVIDTTRFGL